MSIISANPARRSFTVETSAGAGILKGEADEAREISIWLTLVLEHMPRGRQFHAIGGSERVAS